MFHPWGHKHTASRKSTSSAEAAPTTTPLSPAEDILQMQRTHGNRFVQRWLAARRENPVMRQPAPTDAAPADATPDPAAGPTSDTVLNEWLARHPDQHLSTDTTWIFQQWPEGGRMSDLDAGFGADVQGLLDFVAATAGAQFTIISFARSPEKQHVMHVSQWIRRDLMGYSKYKFSKWSGVDAMKKLKGQARLDALDAISNPETLGIVWDTGTASSSKTAATAIAGPSGYGIGANNPCANGGSSFSWPTGDTSKSNHGDGKAVDATPAVLPNVVTIAETQARNWPNQTAANTAFGAANVQFTAATPAKPGQGGAPGTPATPASFTITGLSAVAKRDAFYELFFRVRSAARAGFVDLEHFQAP